MRIHHEVILASLTSFKIGGRADYFCTVGNEKELKNALAFARERAFPVFILGGGTNVLVSDAGFRGLVVKIEMRGVQWGEVVIVEAGENWDALVASAVERGLWGIENLSGIPGTVGAAPIQNIGAYGMELSDVLEWVEVLDCNTNYEQATKVRTRRLSNAECRFGYRDSVFKSEAGKELVVLRIALRLNPNGAPNIAYKDLAEYFAERPAPSLADIRRAVLEIRSRKFPDLATIGTAGSFFKNPVISAEKFAELKKKYPNLPGFPVAENKTKIPLAWILDRVCGMKGYMRGRASLWKNQPLVVVNNGGASADDVRALATDVAARVRSATGLSLEWEVRGV